MDLQRLHGIMSSTNLIGCPSPHSRGAVVTLSTACNANQHHIEGNRDDRRNLVDWKSVKLSIVLKSEITVSNITYCPLFEQTKQTSMAMSTTEYKRAASTITRITCDPVLRALVRLVKTLRSIIQMRYASNARQNQVRMVRHIKLRPYLNSTDSLQV